MNKLYPRANAALFAVSRHEFVACSDLAPSITGHSIPREETVRHLLSLIPEIAPDQTVMHIGGGSGYLTAVLSELARRVIYVERNPVVAEAARERFFRLGKHNVDVVAADIESAPELDVLCDLVLCTTFLPRPRAFPGRCWLPGFPRYGSDRPRSPGPPGSGSARRRACPGRRGGWERW